MMMSISSALLLLFMLSASAINMDEMSEDDVEVMKMYSTFKSEFKKNTGNMLQEKEFIKKMTSSQMQTNTTKMMKASPTNVKWKASSFSWRDRGAVGPVENQGMCGSCWAFSLIGNLEGIWKVKKGDLRRLSKQQLVDCVTSSNGCNGGWPPSALDEIITLGGVQDEQDYPYEESDGRCSMNRRKFRMSINGYIQVEGEDQQAAYLAQHGPLSTCLNADGLQFYKGGVLDLPRNQCDPDALNHAVLTVGYGTHRGIPYWDIKNSWGRHWGDNGYCKIRRGTGMCGIDKVAVSGIVD